MTAQNILPMLPSGSREYKRMKQIGLESIMGVKYGKNEHQFIAVINPRKYGKEGDILRLLARAVDSEIDRLGQPNMGKGFSFGTGKLAKNEVYVKLLNAFELHTRKGVLTEEDITRNQEIIFLTVLLMKQDEGMIPATTLLHMLWEDPEALAEPERTLKNLSYRVNKKLKQLFPRGDFLEIKKKSYMVSRKYKITTDLDRFSYMIRDAEGVTNPKVRLERYLKALDDFSGIVLPQQDHQAIRFVTEKYENARRRAQNECLSLMFELGDYTRMESKRENIVKETEETDQSALFDDEEEAAPVTKVSRKQIMEIYNSMLNSEGITTEDDVVLDMQDAVDTLIFRWNKCLELNPKIAKAATFCTRIK